MMQQCSFYGKMDTCQKRLQVNLPPGGQSPQVAMGAENPMPAAQPHPMMLSSPQETQSAPQAATPVPPPEIDNQPIIEIIQGLIQDERNAQIFYSSLTDTRTGTALLDIANDCKRHSRELTEALAKHFGNNFAPVETEIQKGLELKTALTLALPKKTSPYAP